MYLERPALVKFDPSKKEHRAAARSFMKRLAWVDSPIRFAHDPEFGSVADQVRIKLLNWYMEQEDKRSSKPKTKVVEAIIPKVTVLRKSK